MAQLLAFRPAGNTYFLSVTTNAHSTVTVVTNINDVANYVGMLNTGANAVLVALGTTSNVAAAAAISDGSSASEVVLPPLMTQYITVPVPVSYATGQGQFFISAIGSGAAANGVYVVPVTNI